jgi:hypothetical protein
MIRFGPSPGRNSAGAFQEAPGGPSQLSQQRLLSAETADGKMFPKNQPRLREAHHRELREASTQPSSNGTRHAQRPEHMAVIHCRALGFHEPVATAGEWNGLAARLDRNIVGHIGVANIVRATLSPFSRPRATVPLRLSAVDSHHVCIAWSRRWSSKLTHPAENALYIYMGGKHLNYWRELFRLAPRDRQEETGAGPVMSHHEELCLASKVFGIVAGACGRTWLTSMRPWQVPVTALLILFREAWPNRSRPGSPDGCCSTFIAMSLATSRLPIIAAGGAKAVSLIRTAEGLYLPEVLWRSPESPLEFPE